MELSDSAMEPWYAMINKHLRGFLPPEFPEIVTLCGSTRFKKHYEEVAHRLTMEGKIVISVGNYGHIHTDPVTGKEIALPDLKWTPEQKAKLDWLHLRKIDLCDAVFIINVDGYVGESTTREILYALKRDKDIHWYDRLSGMKLISRMMQDQE